MRTRWSLIAGGACGAYSLGATNIANVRGVFVPVAPFRSVDVGGLFTITGTQQLFLIGGLAIALGVFTYSRRVMETVGGSLMRLTPQMALIVVLSQAVVLFLFSSQSLEAWLQARGLPSLPLVPVSSSQAVIGAVLGLGLMKGGRGIRYRVLGEIAAGWVTTPVIAGVVAFVALFFLQNTFDVPVSRNLTYVLDESVLGRVERLEIRDPSLVDMEGGKWTTQSALERALARETSLGAADRHRIVAAATQDRFVVSWEVIEREFADGGLAAERLAAVRALTGQEYRYGWELWEALARRSGSWRPTSGADGRHQLDRDRDALLLAFRADPAEPPKAD